MIFVTVGTHEQPLNRLISCIDRMKADGLIDEEVVMQIGFSTYEPQYCTWSKILPHKECKRLVEEARIVITHGGPASFILALQHGKTPIVFPRQKAFDEHVNDHQLEFAQQVAQRQGTILLAEDEDQLRDLILNYDNMTQRVRHGFQSNNEQFVKKLEALVDDLFV